MLGAEGGRQKRSARNLAGGLPYFVITGSDQVLLATKVKPLVEAFLHERGLTLSPEKTVVTSSNDGVDFLGQHLRKYQGPLRTIPSAKNTKTFLDKVRTIIAKS